MEPSVSPSDTSVCEASPSMMAPRCTAIRREASMQSERASACWKDLSVALAEKVWTVVAPPAAEVGDDQLQRRAAARHDHGGREGRLESARQAQLRGETEIHIPATGRRCNGPDRARHREKAAKAATQWGGSRSTSRSGHGAVAALWPFIDFKAVFLRFGAVKSGKRCLLHTFFSPFDYD